MSPAQALRAVCGLLAASFVAVLAATVVPVALPRLVADVGVGAAWAPLVVAVELAATAVSVPVWARLARQRPVRASVQAALGLLLAGSLLAGASTGPAVLLTGRLLQGLGAGGLVVLVQVALSAVLPAGGLRRFSGLFGAVFAAATLGGPLLGGLLVDTAALGWRWCFFLPVPITLVALVLLHGALHPQPQADTARPTAAGELLRVRAVALASVAGACVGAVASGGTVALALVLQLSLGHRPVVAGLLLVPVAAGLLAASAGAGAAVAAGSGYRAFLVAGAATVLPAVAVLSRVDGRSSTPLAVAAGAVLGVGLGLLLQSLVRAAQHAVAPGDAAAVGRLLTVAQLLGGTLGLLALSWALAGDAATDALFGLLLPVALVGSAAVLALTLAPGRGARGSEVDHERALRVARQRPTA